MMRMLENLLPAVEKGMMDAAGSIPVVFKGMERSFERSATLTGPSRHEYHELTYLRSGKALFNIQGRRIQIEKGATLIIRPQTVHQIQILDGPADMLVLYFGFSSKAADTQNSRSAYSWSDNIAPQTLEQFIDFASGEDSGLEPATEPFLLLQGKSRQDITTLVERILHEKQRESYGSDLMMQLLAIELLVVLARGLREEWEESLRVRTGKAGELVRIAQRYIVEHHDRDLSIGDVAAYVFLSQGYFTRAFRDETGISPMSFLMQVRVDHACKLLKQADKKVSGIAREVGFSSPQRFNAAFRKHIGMTPMQYRRSLLEEKGPGI